MNKRILLYSVMPVLLYFSACEDLSNPQNGEILFTGRSTAQYSCDPGFYLEGEDSRMCFENTSWSGMEPTCRGM